MRAISPYANYALQVLAPRRMQGVNEAGRLTEFYEGDEVIAQFDKTGLTEWEIEAALTTFNFAGLPADVNPLTRISVWDSEMYCEMVYGDDPALKQRMLEKIDAALLKHAERRGQSEFIIVETPRAAKPWPTYDEMSTEKILTFREEAGINPEIVRLYEVENKGRKTLIEAMLKLEDPAAFAEENEEAVTEGATIS